MRLNFPGRLHLNDIIGRLLGPDMHHAYAVAIDAEFDEENDRTRVTVRPVGPKELEQPGVLVDRWGQPWLRSVMTKDSRLLRLEEAVIPS